MYQSAYAILRKSNGFTFVESLFHLIVLLLFSHFFGFVYFWFHEIESKLEPQELTWEMFVFELQQYIDKSEEIQVTNKTLYLYDEDINATTQISRYGDMIRKQVDNLGHVPLFIGVKQVSFVKNEQNITIKVELENGEIKERSFFAKQIKE